MLDEDKIRDRRLTSLSLVDTSAREISHPLGRESEPEKFRLKYCEVNLTNFFSLYHALSKVFE